MVEALSEGADLMAGAMLWFCVTVVICATLWLVPLAVAKDFEPGDVRVCVAAKCIPLRDRGALDALGVFYYSGKYHPRAVAAPAARARYVELRYRNGYVTGVARASAAIRLLAARLRPRPLPADVLDNSH